MVSAQSWSLPFLVQCEKFSIKAQKFPNSLILTRVVATKFLKQQQFKKQIRNYFIYDMSYLPQTPFS